MIEIVAKLVREQTPAFLCGEVVECFIDFSNPAQAQHRVSQSNSDTHENLAWASVQIHCYLNSTSHREKGSDLQIAELTKVANTSLGTASKQSGDVFHSTKPKILFCDLRLSSGETKSYLYRETLPINGPPTYRGHGIKYFYRITIATQRVKSKVHILSVPIRVLPLPAVVRPEEVPALCNDTNEELAPTNPFLENYNTQSEVEVSWHHLQNITARRLPKFYRISNKRGHVGRFCIFKHAYKLGEDIVGTLDFSNRSVRCCQLSVTLQSEEILHKNRKNSQSSGIDPTNTNSNNTNQENAPSSSDVVGKLTNHTKYHEVCLGMMQTQIIIPIPLFVTPSFSTDLVDVRWRLHFEFVTSADIDFGSADHSAEDWRAPDDIPIETMVWNLPVTLYPTAPLQIFQPCGSYSLVIK
ncbi:unnamed protein product [Hermetia illucens]|uniref:RAB6A-GEF complex partner protein 2 n=1 Tax=Hermetia illucens TaxID=343691 RepID=A0A7R8Z327_HERIL|nr:RAB6A-GEF complex partner protein 2 [Hermetia illucens]CAD7093498.1 unnamed protein product [Hermetia illucens]